MLLRLHRGRGGGRSCSRATTRRWTSWPSPSRCARRRFRVLHAEDIGVGIARAIRAAVSGRPGGVYLDLPAKLFSQTMDAAAGAASLIKVVDPAPRQIPAPDAVQRALDLLKGAKKPLILLGKGAAYARADADIRALVETHRHPLPADVDGQGPAARHARAVGLGRALLRAARGRRGAADRRAAELAAVARQGQDLGRQDHKAWGGQKFIQIDISPTEIDSNVRHRRAAGRRHRLLRGGAAGRHGPELGEAAGRVAERGGRAQATRTSPRWPRRWPRTRSR